MIGFASLAEKTAAWLDKATRDQSRIEAQLAQHDAARPDRTDLDQLIDWKRARRALVEDLESAEEVLTHAKAAAERQAQAAAEAEADRRHAAAQKLARAGEKLTLDVVAAAEKLAEALAALEANRAQVDQANAVRGSRPHIVDGEFRIRSKPGREVPAIVDREFAWVDQDGKRAPLSQIATFGRPAPGAEWNGYTYREVETVLQPARTDPPTMPERLASAIRLVDLHGRSTWPR
jgi:hypothetical protein